MKTRSNSLIIILTLAVCLLFLTVTIAFPQAIKPTVTAQNVSSAENFTALPNDLKISESATVSQTDMALADTYAYESKIIGAPTVVSEVTKANYSTLLSGDTRPSNAILHFDKDANITDEGGNVIDSFENVYKSLDKKIIPIAYVDNAPAADALIQYINNRMFVLDMAVMSDKAELVDRVRKALPHIRGIVEYKLLPQKLYTIVEQSTKAQAMTVVIPQNKATVEAVAYLQARFKTVWVRENGETAGDIFGCINSGCYGIVTTNSAAVYAAMDKYEGHVRNIFNVAHRGLPNLYNENSLSGIKAALCAGVTHIELDGHLTKDKRIVITHDDSIDRVTNGSGKINDLTLEQIWSYDLDLKTPTEKMPTLEQAIDTIIKLNAGLSADVVLVFEIKDNSPDFVDCMKKILDEKNFYENIVFITFEGTTHQLSALKEKIPQVPTANLDSITKTTFASELAALNRYNTGIDNNLSNYNREYAAQMRDRGFLGWYWTYSAESDVLAAEKEGILGVTTNSADCFGKHVRFILGEGMTNADVTDVPANGDEITLTAMLYDGTKVAVTGVVTLCEHTADGWRVLAEYEEKSGANSHVHRTHFIYYYAPVKSGDKDFILPFLLGVLLGAVITAPIMLIIKKRKTKHKRQQ